MPEQPVHTHSESCCAGVGDSAAEVMNTDYEYCLPNMLGLAPDRRTDSSKASNHAASQSTGTTNSNSQSKSESTEAYTIINPKTKTSSSGTYTSSSSVYTKSTSTATPDRLSLACWNSSASDRGLDSSTSLVSSRARHRRHDPLPAGSLAEESVLHEGSEHNGHGTKNKLEAVHVRVSPKMLLPQLTLRRSELLCVVPTYQPTVFKHHHFSFWPLLPSHASVSVGCDILLLSVRLLQHPLLLCVSHADCAGGAAGTSRTGSAAGHQ